MVYSQKRKVSASLCGTEAKLSVIGIMDLVEDAATEVSAALGIDGITAMKKYNTIIVYAKNHIKIFGSAKWKEELNIDSFVSSRRSFSYCIDTCIRNSDNELIAYSVIELCGIDKDGMRLRKTDTYGVDGSIAAEERMSDVRFFDRHDYDMTYVESVRVRSANIDYVHHTNNIEYVRFIISTFGVDELEAHPVRELEVKYVNQSYEGDMLDIFSGIDGDRHGYEIKNGDKTIMKCEIVTEG